ncbi:MAG: glycerophosphoryl diester phosphodiesterase [Bacteriovoracaceae bacterium]
MEGFKQFLQLLVDLVIFIIPWPMPSDKKIKNAKIVAHRGWHGKDDIKENSLEAFQAAVDHDLWGIEFDVRWTKDGVPVVHHDAHCLRVWGFDYYIRDLTYLELRKAIPEIPSLEEVVVKFGKQIHLFIELKKENFSNLAEKKLLLQQILKPLSAIDDFHIICLSVSPIQDFDLFDLKTYLLVGDLNLLEMSQLALTNHYGGVTGHYLLSTQEVLDKHEDAGQKVGTGFIRTQACMKREMNRDVEWFFTNHPWNLIGIFESIESGGSEN